MVDPSVADLAKQLADQVRIVGETQTAMNILWTLLAGFLVMLMQGGFALVETGLTRARSAAHTVGMTFLSYAIAVVAFWALGFALQTGGSAGLSTTLGDLPLKSELVLHLRGHALGVLGLQGFFLAPTIYSAAVAALFLFQAGLAATATVIPTGAMAERWRFSAFVVFSLVMAGVVYPVYANWVWGGGWLADLGRTFGLGHGHVDFAGGSVVHMVGGVAALVGAKHLGPRQGKYDAAGRPQPLPGHNVPMVALGSFVLAFGWFGLTTGSALSANDTRIAVIATNTMLASASGALGAFFYLKMRFGKPDVTLLCNGMLGGLVAITAPCAFVTAPSAVLIGAVAGVLVIASALFVENNLRIDDPVGAASVHGTCGAWGILSVGLLADGRYGEGWNNVPGPVRGLFYGDSRQLAASAIGLAANLVWVGLTTYVTLKVVDALVGNRTRADEELAGLDLAEMGIEGYGVEPVAPPPSAPVIVPIPSASGAWPAVRTGPLPGSPLGKG